MQNVLVSIATFLYQDSSRHLSSVANTQILREFFPSEISDELVSLVTDEFAFFLKSLHSLGPWLALNLHQTEHLCLYLGEALD